MDEHNVDRRRRLYLLGLLAQGALGNTSCGGSSSDEPKGKAQATSTIAPDSSPAVQFPLRVEAGKRYIVDAAGRPFLIHGDTAWSIVGQLTDSEIDLYIDDRAAKGFTVILFNAPEAYYTSQTPGYNNVDGVPPFKSMSPVDWTNPVQAYWRRVDRIVNRCKARGMACLIFPAYLGYEGGSDGWRTQVAATSDGDLQTYGAWIANRFTQGNVLWAMGGDYQGKDAASITKQWNIAVGIRTVRPNDIITGHGHKEAYSYWKGKAGWNLNSTYFAEDDGDYFYTRCSSAFGRSGPIPFLHLEGRYEQEMSPPVSVSALRKQNYASYLSGACGYFFGNNPIWHFECASGRAPFPYTGTWVSNLDSTGSTQQRYVKALFAAFEWWRLVPNADTSLVTSSLGSQAGRIYPASASDGTFAMIYVPNSRTVSVLMSALSPSRLRARLYNPANGKYEAIPGSPFPNSGTVNFTTPAERVIVLDAAA